MQSIWICASCSDVVAPYLFLFGMSQGARCVQDASWPQTGHGSFLNVSNKWAAMTAGHNNFSWETGISRTHRVCDMHPYNSSLKVARAALHQLGKDAWYIAGNVYCSVQAVSLFLFSWRTIEARRVGVKANVSFFSLKTQVKLKAMNFSEMQVQNSGEWSKILK